MTEIKLRSRPWIDHWEWLRVNEELKARQNTKWPPQWLLCYVNKKNERDIEEKEEGTQPLKKTTNFFRIIKKKLTRYLKKRFGISTKTTPHNLTGFLKISSKQQRMKIPVKKKNIVHSTLRTPICIYCNTHYWGDTKSTSSQRSSPYALHHTTFISLSFTMNLGCWESLVKGLSVKNEKTPPPPQQQRIHHQSYFFFIFGEPYIPVCFLYLSLEPGRIGINGH